MNAQDAIDILQRNADTLRARGVLHAALFGSVARGQAKPDSDIDIMIELDPRASIGAFGYVGIKRFIAAQFARSVDVINKDALRPELRGSAERDAIYAF